MNEAFKELADFCQGSRREDTEIPSSDALSLPLLREKLEAGPDGIVRGNLSDEVEDGTTLLHYVCYNRRVTLDIVRYLVSLYPEAVKVRTDYGWLPIHRACNNAACPDEVVEYLVGLFPDALGVSWPPAGLPLHCMLSRGKVDGEEVHRPLNLDLVRMLVEAYPVALMNQDNEGDNTPLLCACEREDLSMDMVRLLVDPDLSAVGLAGNYGGEIPLLALMKKYHSAEALRPPFDVIRFFVESAPDTVTPSVVNKICRSRNVTLKLVELIVETRPDVSFMDQADGEGGGLLPLHNLCLNENKKDQDSWLLPIIEYVVSLYPEAVRRRNHYGFLPLSYAVSSTLEITKLLVEKYPESVSMSSPRGGGTAFHSACRQGGLDVVKYLYEKKPDAINSVGNPALHLPFESDRDVEAKFDFLLEKGPQLIRAKDPSTGYLPLHAACSEHSWSIDRIKKVFELYPDAVATRNIEGRFPLHEFLARDRFILEMKENNKGKEALETVMFLVTQFPSSVRVADNEGMLPLHYASKYYHASIVLHLAHAYPDGVKLDSPKFGLPLHCASERLCGRYFKSSLVIFDYLLSLYPMAIGKRNETVGFPLECADSKDMFQKLLILRYSGKSGFLLHCVLQDEAFLNPDSVVRVFLKYFRGNVSQIDNFGRYPLHIAVSSSRASHYVVNELLNYQPAVVHQDKQGCIPLHLFFRHSSSMEATVCEEILNELLNHGHNSAQILDHAGSLPLHYACRYGSETNSLVTLIDSFPEAVRVADRYGCIPLHVACRRGVLPVDDIRRLLAYDNTTIQTADKDLELPLHKACRGGHLEIINCLLDQFAPASGMRNASGSLPIRILCQKSGKMDISIMDAPAFTETVFRLLRAHPEAVMT